MSYKVQIKFKGESHFVSNIVRFATEEEAEDYGIYKLLTWDAADKFLVDESNEPVNYRWDSKAGLVPVESSSR
jgi:hypothetical protein